MATESEDKKVVIESAPGWTWATLVAVCLIFILGGWISSCRANAKAMADTTQCHSEEEDEWVRTPTGSYRDSKGKCVVGTPPVPRPAEAAIPAQRLRTPQTLEIPQEGLRVWLEEAPAIYPKLGSIRVQTPSGRSYIDTPGVDYYPGYEPAGWYTFRPKPLGEERKVQIYNRW